MTEIIVPFSYTELPAPVAAELQAITSRIKDRLVRQVEDIIETGRDLLEVKSKLQHGQFEAWLNVSFNMTMRTAQKYMLAAEWMADKSELGSYLTPNTIYLLSAPSTPESVRQKVIEAVRSGEPAKADDIRELIHKVKDQELLKKTLEKRKEDSEREKSSKVYRDRERHKNNEERQRIETAAMEVAREVADILVNKLSEDEIKKVNDALIDINVTCMILRKAIFDARESLGDNVTVFPSKPWESKT